VSLAALFRGVIDTASIGRRGQPHLCAPTGRIKSRNANMLHLNPCALGPSPDSGGGQRQNQCRDR
jgi:hypothetical protein